MSLYYLDYGDEGILPSGWYSDVLRTSNNGWRRFDSKEAGVAAESAATGAPVKVIEPPKPKEQNPSDLFLNASLVDAPLEGLKRWGVSDPKNLAVKWVTQETGPDALQFYDKTTGKDVGLLGGSLGQGPGLGVDRNGNIVGVTYPDQGGFWSNLTSGVKDLVTSPAGAMVLAPITGGALGATAATAATAVQAANAIDQGNVLGGLAMLAGVPGVSEAAKAADLGAVVNAVQTANQVAKLENAIESGNVLGAISSGVGLTGTGGTQLGDTGYTVSDAIKAANIASAVEQGNVVPLITSIAKQGNAAQKPVESYTTQTSAELPDEFATDEAAEPEPEVPVEPPQTIEDLLKELEQPTPAEPTEPEPAPVEPEAPAPQEPVGPPTPEEDQKSIDDLLNELTPYEQPDVADPGIKTPGNEYLQDSEVDLPEEVATDIENDVPIEFNPEDTQNPVAELPNEVATDIENDVPIEFDPEDTENPVETLTDKEVTDITGGGTPGGTTGGGTTGGGLKDLNANLGKTVASLLGGLAVANNLGGGNASDQNSQPQNQKYLAMQWNPQAINQVRNGIAYGQQFFNPTFTETDVAAAAGGLMSLAQGGPAMSHLGGYSDGGRLLRGPGDGMSDHIPASIGGRQPARLADGEFVIPADVVSHLGNGSTEAGSRVLYEMMDRVRKARTGNKKQGKQINPNKFIPR